jgi:hypothetical protein
VTIPIISQCPVVLALRALDEPAGDRGRARLRRASLQRLDVPEAERLEHRQVEPPDRLREVPECVRALVAVVAGIRELAGTDPVQHDHAGSGHRAILRAGMETVLGLIGLAFFIVCVISLAAAVTWTVVKLTPQRDKTKTPASP